MNIKPNKAIITTLFVFSSALPLIAMSGERTEEVLMGVNFTAEEIELHVASGGCTKKESFSIEVDKGITGKFPYMLRVYRVHPDNCKAFLSDGVTVTFSKEELGLSGVFEINLLNKLGNTSQHR